MELIHDFGTSLFNTVQTLLLSTGYTTP